MGMIIKGAWVDEDYVIDNGAYIREKSIYDSTLNDETINSIAENPERYRLVISLSCPWSHGVTLVHGMKMLGDHVPITIVTKGDEGYAFDENAPYINGSQISHLHQLYTHSDQEYSGRSTVPILWDTEVNKIISNDSSHIMSALDCLNLGKHDYVLRPANFIEDIERLNKELYNELTNAVYCAGFAQSQEAYDMSVSRIFLLLDRLEDRLSTSRFLLGSFICECDLKLFSTLVKFDICYYLFHLCCKKRICEYNNLWAYSRDIYSIPGVSETVNFEAMFDATLRSDFPGRIPYFKPVMPSIDWHQEHKRGSLGPRRVFLSSGKSIEI